MQRRGSQGSQNSGEAAGIGRQPSSTSGLGGLGSFLGGNGGGETPGSQRPVDDATPARRTSNRSNAEDATPGRRMSNRSNAEDATPGRRTSNRGIAEDAPQATVSGSSRTAPKAPAPKPVDPVTAQKRRLVVAHQYYDRPVREQRWQPVLCTDGVQLLWQRWRYLRISCSACLCLSGVAGASWAAGLLP